MQELAFSQTANRRRLGDPHCTGQTSCSATPVCTKAISLELVRMLES